MIKRKRNQILAQIREFFRLRRQEHTFGEQGSNPYHIERGHQKI